MSYVYPKVKSLEGTPKVGTEQCVELVKFYAKAPATMSWRQGEAVLGNKNLSIGTAIATFENEKYPNKPHGNHAALYLGQTANGIIVMDQWRSVRKLRVSSRTIIKKGRDKQGRFNEPSDNAEAFFVVE